MIGNSQSRSTVFDVAGSETAKTSRAFKIGPQTEVAVGTRSNVEVGPINESGIVYHQKSYSKAEGWSAVMLYVFSY